MTQSILTPMEAANKFSRSQSEEEFIIKDFSMKMAIKFQVSSILCYKAVHLQGTFDLKVCFDDCKQTKSISNWCDILAHGFDFSIFL